jgi:hypothetical protein
MELAYCWALFGAFVIAAERLCVAALIFPLSCCMALVANDEPELTKAVKLDNWGVTYVDTKLAMVLLLS